MRDPAASALPPGRPESAAARAAADAAADQNDEEYDDDESGQEEADWGLPGERKKVAWQTVLGLTVIAVLLGMFSILIYKKVQDRKAALALKGDAPPSHSETNATEETSSGAILPTAAIGKAKETGAEPAKGESQVAGITEPIQLPDEGSSSKKGSRSPAKSKAEEVQELLALEPVEKSALAPPVEEKNSAPEIAMLPGLENEPAEGKPAKAAASHSGGLAAERPNHGTAKVGKSADSGIAVPAKSADSELALPAETELIAEEPPQAGTTKSNTADSAPGKSPASELPEEPSLEPAGKTPPATPGTSPANPVETSPVLKSRQSEPVLQPSPKTPVKTFAELPERTAENGDPPTRKTRPATPEKLGGYEIANEVVPQRLPEDPAAERKSVSSPPPATTAVSPAPTTIVTPSAPAQTDPRLGEYEVAREPEVRASSKTMVTKPPEMLRSASPKVITEVAQNDASTPLSAQEELPASEPQTPLIGVSPRNARARIAAEPTPVAVPGRAPSSAVSPPQETYVVAPGDSYWSISRKNYGTGRYYQALLEHNREKISDPNRMRPGMMISTPDREILEQKYPQLIDKAPAQAAPTAGGRPSAVRGVVPGSQRAILPTAGEETAGGFFVGPNGQPMYRVGESDTLTDISQRHLGRASRWAEIYERNRDAIPNPDALKIGTVIRLPNDASRLSVVPEAGPRR